MGPILLFSAAALWGLIGPLSKLIFAGGMLPLETAFWRGSFAGLAFFIHWLFNRHPLPCSLKQITAIVLFGLFGVALLEGSFVYAVSYGGAALASVLLYSAPIWVNIAGVLFFKESIPLKQRLSLSLAFSGVLGICLWGGNADFSAPALVWGLLSGLSYASFYISGKVFFRHTHPVVVYMIAFPVASLAILSVILITSPSSVSETVSHLVSLKAETITASLLMGLVCTYLPYLLYGAGLKLVETSRAAIMTMVEPVVSVAIAAVMWGELFSVQGYLFAALVIIGVAMA